MTQAALILIDMQQGFTDPGWGRRNQPKLEQTIADLLEHWRAIGGRVVHVRHDSTDPRSPLRPGQTGNALIHRPRSEAGEIVVAKSVNSAFIGTDLQAHLTSWQCDRLTLAGLTSDHCVSTTARMAGNLGYAVTVVADATATFPRRCYDGEMIDAETIHRAALSSLHDEFAQVMTFEQLLEVYKRCD